MKKTHNYITKNIVRATRFHERRNGLQIVWRTLLATVAFTFGTSTLRAADFNDGGTHTINDASYESEAINVSNNTTLVIQPGAVFNGVGLVEYQVHVSDTSTLIIQGGTFGGTGDYSGAVSAEGSSSVTINGGTFGSTGLDAGAIHAYDTSKLIINGGTFAGPGDSFAGTVILEGASTTTINGGTFGAGENGSAVWAKGTSTLTINGGTLARILDPVLHKDIVVVVASENSKVTFRAAAIDSTGFNPLLGGELVVTFCSQSEQHIAMLIADAPSIAFETISCGSDAIENLISEVNSLTGVHQGIRTALLDKLNAASAALGLGDTATACARLQDFINLCRAQQGKKLEVTTANSLIAEAQSIRGLIGCP